MFPPPGTNIYKVFATEFFCTFILAHTAFTVALADAENQKAKTLPMQTATDSQGLTLYTTTPLSKAGFAPFAIGFVAFSLSIMGGTAGVALNPARRFGPAVFSGEWGYFFVYTIAQFSGAGLASLLVQKVHQFRKFLED